MNELFLRIGKKWKTPWESEVTLDDLVEAEFTDPNTGKPDLCISVYKVTADQVTQIFVEHCANANLNLPTGKVNVSFHGARNIQARPETGLFKLVNDTHHEVLFRSVNDLHDFLILVRQDTVSNRFYHVSSADIKKFIRTRLKACDPTWIKVAGENKTWNI